MIRSEKVKRHVRLIAHDPAVMWDRRNMEEFARAQFEYGAILERRGSRAGHDQSNMFYKTVCGPCFCPDMLAPFPSGLVSRASNCHPSQMYDFKPALLKNADFIRRLESFENDICLFGVHICLSINGGFHERESNKALDVVRRINVRCPRRKRNRPNSIGVLQDN